LHSLLPTGDFYYNPKQTIPFGTHSLLTFVFGFVGFFEKTKSAAPVAACRLPSSAAAATTKTALIAACTLEEGLRLQQTNKQ
jgi:hypothetical protein